MAWTAPRTWTTGEVPTAAIFNTHVRDNLLALRDPPRCVLYLNGANQSVASGTADVKINVDTVEVDSDGFADLANKRILIPTGLGGVYMVGGGIRWDANATGIRFVRVAVNGALKMGASAAPNTAATSHFVSVQRPLVLAAGDYIELNGIQNSGGALNATTGIQHTWLSAVRV